MPRQQAPAAPPRASNGDGGEELNPFRIALAQFDKAGIIAEPANGPTF